MIHPVFQRDFDLEIAEEAAQAEHDARARYTEEELAEAIARAREEGREEGRAEGHAAGLAEARGTLAAQQSAALAVLGPKLDMLLGEAAAHRAALEAQVLDFTVSVCEKVFPELLHERARARTLAQIRRCLQFALGSSSLRVVLSPGALDELGPRLSGMCAEAGVTARLEMSADPDLAAGDARVEWDNGFLDYSLAAVCERILDALRESRDALTETSLHGNATDA